MPWPSGKGGHYRYSQSYSLVVATPALTSPTLCLKTKLGKGPVQYSTRGSLNSQFTVLHSAMPSIVWMWPRATSTTLEQNVCCFGEAVGCRFYLARQTR